MNAAEDLRARDRAIAAGLAGGLALLVSVLALALSDPPLERAVRALAFWLLSLVPLLLVLPAWLRAARRAADWRPSRWMFAVAVLAPVLIDRMVRGSVRDMVGALLYVSAALLLTADRPRAPRPLWRDALLVFCLWIPLEVKWVTGDFVLLRLLGLDLLLLLFVVERPIWELGRIIPRRRAEFGWAIGCWAGFLALAVPVGMASGFAAPGVAQRPPGEWALFLVSVFWITALPEEALFRGTIQGLLAKVMRPEVWALLIAAILFGLSHLNNVGLDRRGDWRYVLLASVAGVAYGLAFIKTRNLAAPTLTHFLVDVTWRGFFAGLGTHPV